jgi:phospho-N-acetylmuramoyl-pentapeptide-transferase
VLQVGSDVVQIGYFKLTGGKRLFRRAPFHHHLELIGWTETQIVTRFWLISIVAAMIGVALALEVPEK